MPTAAAAKLTAREPGKVIGAPSIRPCSFPAAMIEPENVTAPISTSRMVKMVTDSATPAAEPATARSR